MERNTSKMGKYGSLLIIGFGLAIYCLATGFAIAGYKNVSLALFGCFIIYGAEHVSNFIRRSNNKIISKYANTFIKQVCAFGLPAALSYSTWYIANAI